MEYFILDDNKKKERNFHEIKIQELYKVYSDKIIIKRRRRDEEWAFLQDS